MIGDEGWLERDRLEDAEINRIVKANMSRIAYMKLTGQLGEVNWSAG